MGGIVSRFRTKNHTEPGTVATNAEGMDVVGEEKKSDDDEDEEKFGEKNETACPPSSGKENLSVGPEFNENAHEILDQKPKEPEKPLDLIYSLDLYSNPSTITNQIREHFDNLKNLSEEMKATFLSQPEKSYASKKKIKIKKLLFQPAVHLKELKHKWLRHFEIHLNSFPDFKVICLDLHFYQLTSFKQIKSKYLNQAMIINASENRIYSIDLIKIIIPSPPLPEPPQVPVESAEGKEAQPAGESEGEEKSQESGQAKEPSEESGGQEKPPQESEEGKEPLQESGEEKSPGKSGVGGDNETKQPQENETLTATHPPQPPPPSLSLPPLAIPTPHLYPHLMFLNLSTNYLFSLYGVQCCPHLKCLVASDNMITSLWPLVHCLSLEYLDVTRNQLTHLLCPTDLSYIRNSQYISPPEAREMLRDDRPTHLPTTITFLDVSYNQHLISLEGLEPLSKLIHFEASHCSLTEISPLSQHLFLSHLSLHSNRLSDLRHIFSTLQSLPSITSLHLHPNPFFTSLTSSPSPSSPSPSSPSPSSPSPSSPSAFPSSSVFSLSSYSIMFLHLYRNQLLELDHLLILPSDYQRLDSLLHQINQEHLVDLIATSHHNALSNQILHFNKLKSFHQIIERLFQNQIKDLERESQDDMTKQVEFIRKEVKMLTTVKSLEELYDLEEIRDQRERLIEKGILQRRRQEREQDQGVKREVLGKEGEEKEEKDEKEKEIKMSEAEGEGKGERETAQRKGEESEEEEEKGGVEGRGEGRGEGEAEEEKGSSRKSSKGALGSAAGGGDEDEEKDQEKSVNKPPPPPLDIDTTTKQTGVPPLLASAKKSSSRHRRSKKSSSSRLSSATSRTSGDSSPSRSSHSRSSRSRSSSRSSTSSRSRSRSSSSGSRSRSSSGGSRGRSISERSVSQSLPSSPLSKENTNLSKEKEEKDLEETREPSSRS